MLIIVHKEGMHLYTCTHTNKSSMAVMASFESMKWYQSTLKCESSSAFNKLLIMAMLCSLLVCSPEKYQWTNDMNKYFRQYYLPRHFDHSSVLQQCEIVYWTDDEQTDTVSLTHPANSIQVTLNIFSSWI